MSYNSLRPKEIVYIPLEEIDFTWLESEIRCVKWLRSNGKTVDEIASIFERDRKEVLALIIDLMGKEEIKAISKYI